MISKGRSLFDEMNASRSNMLFLDIAPLITHSFVLQSVSSWRTPTTFWRHDSRCWPRGERTEAPPTLLSYLTTTCLCRWSECFRSINVSSSFWSSSRCVRVCRWVRVSVRAAFALFRHWSSQPWMKCRASASASSSPPPSSSPPSPSPSPWPSSPLHLVLFDDLERAEIHFGYATRLTSSSAN